MSLIFFHKLSHTIIPSLYGAISILDTTLSFLQVASNAKVLHQLVCGKCCQLVRGQIHWAFPAIKWKIFKFKRKFYLSKVIYQKINFIKKIHFHIILTCKACCKVTNVLRKPLLMEYRKIKKTLRCWIKADTKLQIN